MPNQTVPDETPAWIRGDLPAEESDADTQPAATPLAGSGEPRPAAEPVPLTPEPAVSGALAPALAPEAEPHPGALPIDASASAQPEAETSPASQSFPPSRGAHETAPAGADGQEPGPAVDDMRPAPERMPTAPVPLESVTLSAPMELSLEAQIESLLFVADGAVPVGRLAEALEVTSREVESALNVLGQSYHQRGLSLQRFRDKVQLTTSPASAARVERFLGLAAASPLTRASLETLAIVAYQQPVTRPQIEAVRGVNSDSVIKNLLGKGLIEESGRAEGPGRPVLYVTTPEFMQHFGLTSLSDLPPLSMPTPDSPASPASPEGILKG